MVLYILADSFDVFIESLMDVQHRYFARRSKDILENISKYTPLAESLPYS